MAQRQTDTGPQDETTSAMPADSTTGSERPAGGTGADETARLHARITVLEADLARLRARVGAAETLQTIVCESPVVALRWRLEPGWPVEFVSGNIARYGYTAAELMAGDVAWFDVLEPVEGAGAEFADDPDHVGPYRLLTYALRTQDGHKRLVRFVIRTVRDGQGRLACEGLMRDSPQRLEDEERLRLLEQAVNMARNGIIIADARAPDLPVIFANRAVKRISGYAPEEFLGRNCRFLQGSDRQQPGLDLVRAAIHERRSCDSILRNYRKDGTPFWNEVRISPVTNRHGDVTHFIGVQADITARKHAQDALARRDAILDAVSRATEKLLRSDDYEKALPAALRDIGPVTGADHLCVWRQGSTQNGRTLNLVQVWSGPRAATYRLADFQDIPWEATLGWPSSDLLRSGHWAQGDLTVCTEQERTLVERMGMRSFLCLPVFEGPDRFWGALTLGCVSAGVAWEPTEVEALLSATRVLGAMIQNRNTARALHATEQRFRSLVSNLKEVVFQTDAAGNWTYLNRAWTEVTGFTHAESIGQHFLNFVHPDDRERNNRLFAPLIERKKEYCRHQVRYLTKAGGFRWIEVFARLSLDDQDRITGTAGTLTDVSERVEAEDTRRRQQAAIEAAIDGVAMLSADGVFRSLNSTHLTMFGYDAETDLLGRSWRELYAPAEVRFVEQQVLPAMRVQGRWRGVLTARRRDGSTFDEELSLTLVEGGGIACVCRDVTETRRNAARIERSLREKEVMLKEIHHRVKNNLQIVSSLLSLQLEHVRGEETRSLFLDAQSRIASMALVHEKLYRSADLGSIDLSDYVRDLTDNLIGAQGARARGIEFRLSIGEVHVGIDTAIPCGLIINELVSNAYKHAFPAGGPGVVELALTRAGERSLTLEVADSGRGLPADFDRRQTCSLGMQLVATLVQQLRGSLEVGRGPGARFVLHLHEVPQKKILP